MNSPWISITLFFVFAAVSVRFMMPTTYDTEFDLETFGKLPIQQNGRIKPLDSAARNNLMLVAKRTTLTNRGETQMIPGSPQGTKMDAVEWLAYVALQPEYADTLRIFKVEFPDDLGLAGLAEISKRYYSFSDLRPYLDELRERVQRIDLEDPNIAPQDEQLTQLWNAIGRYDALTRSLNQGFNLDTVAQEYQALQQVVPFIAQELIRQQNGEEANETLLEQFRNTAERYQFLAQSSLLRIIPSDDDELKETDWYNIGEALLKVVETGEMHPYVLQYGRMTEAFRSGDTELFNQVVTEMKADFNATYPDEITHVHVEYGFNQAAPFSAAIFLYIVIFLFACGSWLGWTKPLWNSAYWLCILAFVIHSAAILLRMYIHGRPPVTNLYSSAVFVGWGSTLLALLLEKYWRNGIGMAAASSIGIITLIIAHQLAILSGDTLEMVRAVLDSNFWLATHVIVITFGYSAVFAAGFLGIFFIIKGIFGKTFSRKEATSLNSMVYGITCFAALFSLVGTILGGIWGDQSWGRFWGWDPKENGALLIVIWTAIILHVRWGGLSSPRGIMNLAIFGNIVCAWSWFGTNMLGVGLHSYGFMDAAFKPLKLFVLSQLLIMGLSLVPYRFWRSEYGQLMAKREDKATCSKSKNSALLGDPAQ
ncbi:MAG: cytochrome c biogenesis protein CcsA [Opitutales bacterium]|nr:cytochrome c biogenesis protein CcsA [Opitutales bacterium]